MNRFLVLISGAMVAISIMTFALWIFGYAIGDILEVLVALPLGTVVATLFLIFILVPIADITSWMLRLSIKTVGRNNMKLVTFTRKFHTSVSNPPDAFFVLLIVCASSMTLRFLATVDPSALTSPGLMADMIVSSIFWGLLVAMEKLAA